jgi:hypothetical protein
MHGDGSSFGEAEAQQVLDAGWRQGSVFRPPDGVALPISFDREHEWLVVCTQSCTVVSRDLAGDPHIEFLVARPAWPYKANSPEATGRTLRRFHLPLSGIAGVEALECDINRRFFAPRELCLTHPPEAGITVTEDNARNLAGWISRYYTRVALPNELVIRAAKLFEIIKAALKKNTTSGGSERLSTSIDKILVLWSPDIELQDGLYELDILFLCADEASDLRLNSLLKTKLQPFTEEGGQDGINLTYANMVKSETFISQLDGYKRLSEWDYLSNLGDVAESEQ